MEIQWWQYKRPLLVYILNNNLHLAIGAQMQNLRAKSRVYYPVTGLVGFETVSAPHQTSRGLSSSSWTRFQGRHVTWIDTYMGHDTLYASERK